MFSGLVGRRDQWQAVQPEVEKALRLVRSGIAAGDPESVGRGATISATAGLRVLPKPMLQSVLEFAHAVGAAGVTAGHSGAVIGVLLDSREGRGEALRRLAKDFFPQARTVSLFRLVGGAVRPATPQYS